MTLDRNPSECYRESPLSRGQQPTVNVGKPPLISFPQSISQALRRLQQELGGKNLASHFDGRDGREVAESTLSRWISEPTRFPAHILPVLVEMDGPFRAQVFALLTARLAVPEELMRRLSPEAAEQVARVTESLIVEEVSPGRWVRR